MKIVISKDAAKIYSGTVGTQGHINWPWYYCLVAVAGETLEVETNHLFDDQFNAAGWNDDKIKYGIEKIIKHKAGGSLFPNEEKEIRQGLGMGLRIRGNQVSRVINDVRPFYLKCRWCGKMSSVTEFRVGERCPICKGPDNILKSLIKKSWESIDYLAERYNLQQ